LSQASRLFNLERAKCERVLAITSSDHASPVFGSARCDDTHPYSALGREVAGRSRIWDSP
jgi:hypothetical protein